MAHLALIACVLLAACGAEHGEPPRAGQTEAVAVVEAVFTRILGPATMADAQPEIRWSEQICPHPAPDGFLKTAVIDAHGACFEGLSTGCQISVAWRGTFARSAFAHELMHCYMSHVGLRDPDHDRYPEHWRTVKEANHALAEAGL